MNELIRTDTDLFEKLRHSIIDLICEYQLTYNEADNLMIMFNEYWANHQMKRQKFSASLNTESDVVICPPQS